MSFTLTSSAFSEGEMIPTKYTCDGEDVSPPLRWQDAPEDTQSFALICDDPDAPGMTFVHWVIFNIPGTATSLAEGVNPARELPDGSRQGTTNFNKIGYGGPCPPGGTHRYYFKLYALDTQLDLKAGISKEDLLSEMEGHIIAQTQLMGKYAR